MVKQVSVPYSGKVRNMTEKSTHNSHLKRGTLLSRPFDFADYPSKLRKGRHQLCERSCRVGLRPMSRDLIIATN